MQVPVTPRCTQLTGSEVARAFAHLALVCFILIPPGESDSPSYSKWDVVLPNMGNQVNHLYQAVVDWWEKEALSSLHTSFPSRPSINFYHIFDSGRLTNAGEFVYSDVSQDGYTV